ncbi:MAG: hypothetical protein ABSD42_00425 [Candidatus Bathyarchaeia archaeon]|jgi:hypothetical protein
MMNGVSGDGIVSANYSYSWTWNNSTGTTESGSSSGDFTFSSVNFLYVNGTDNQTGYVNPTVWFCMDNSIPKGGSFYLLNTEMTVISKNNSYYLPSQNRNVNTIFAQGTSNYQRNDQYGQFAATYTWKAYFDPSTGYIIGYSYVEHDTNSSGSGFTYTDNLYVNSASYPLTTAAASNSSGGNSSPPQYFSYIIGIILVLVVIAILIYALSRRSRRTLPKHSQRQPYQQDSPPPGPPPENIDLTPKQPPVQQIVIKEVVKVKCRYCGALIDSTAQTCPICGAPRT